MFPSQAGKKHTLLLENSSVRLAAPQGQLGAERFSDSIPELGDRAPVTQEIPDRPGILGLEVLVETKIPAQLSEDMKAKRVPVTQAAHCK